MPASRSRRTSPAPLSVHHRLLLCAIALAFPLIVSAADLTLVPAGSLWRYLDNGSQPPAEWRSAPFNDSAWSSGPAELGYGDGDERTVVSYGPDAAQKYITTYFRGAFNVGNPEVFTGLNLRVKRDDGAVVYLNGVEVWRSNMPAGPIGYQTRALSSVADEGVFIPVTIPATALVPGRNVLAAEIHQVDPASSDISFDLELIGTTTITLTRGPYLQMGTPDSVRVRWRTNGPTNSRVRYGTSATNLNLVADDPASTTEHEVALSGLSPSTTYFYSVGSTTEVYAGDASYQFVTAPPPDSAIPTRIWVLGDSGTANDQARAVRDAYLSSTPSVYTNLWLMLGDNAYENGTEAEYQAAVFDTYPTVLRKSVLWTTLGNHDTGQSTTGIDFPYFRNFSLPTQAEAGGVPSGTEKYFSFDYGNIHFISLDSFTSDRSPTGPMLTWLRNDLMATDKQWIVAFWHHEPYSKGSHDSDADFEIQTRQMRENALPILEQFGADLVLSGNSHNYERSYLINGHYGPSSTFTSAMKLNGGSGRPEGSGAYEKRSARRGPNEGTVYAVVGSSGLIEQGGTLDHPAMYFSARRLGSMVLDVTGNQLNGRFIDDTGATLDSFSIVKAAPPNAPAGLTATAASSTRVELQWTDRSTVEDGFRVERCTGSRCTSFASIATPGPSSTTYADATVTAGTTYVYRVIALNANGTSAPSNPATIDVPCTPPAITSHPQPATITSGSSTTLTVAATGDSPSYQWYVGESGDTSAPLPGGSTPSITVAPRTTTKYWVLVWNECGVVNSSAATVTVTPCSYAVTPSSFAFPSGGGTGSIVISTTPGCSWTVSTSDSWIAINSGGTGSGDGEATFSVAATTGQQRSGSIVAAGTVIPIAQEAYAVGSQPPTAPNSVTARATGSGQVTVSWAPVAAATTYQIRRRSAGGAVVVFDGATGNSFVDNTVSPASAYLYSVRALNAAGSSADSPSDLATTVLFTDDPLIAGATIIRAVHVTELRTAINAVRALASLPPYPFAGGAAPGALISALDISELRSALDEALPTLGRPSGGYTDAVGAGTPVKAVHVQELRNRVK